MSIIGKKSREDLVRSFASRTGANISLSTLSPEYIYVGIGDEAWSDIVGRKIQRYSLAPNEVAEIILGHYSDFVQFTHQGRLSKDDLRAIEGLQRAMVGLSLEQISFLAGMDTKVPDEQSDNYLEGIVQNMLSWQG